MKLPAFFQPRVSHVELLLFTKHLAVMIKSGISILDALDTVREQTKTTYFRSVLDSIYADVKNGQSLASSLRKYPNVFDHFYLSLIEVGELSGTLEKNLDFLSVQLAKDFQLKKKVQGALIYPALVLGATLILGGVIAFFVLPKLMDFFLAFGTTLPLPTRILIFVANSIRSYGLIILVGIILLYGVGIVLSRNRSIRSIFHQGLIRMPLFGKVLQYQELARFTRNYGMLLSSGISSVRGLEITSKTLSNVVFQRDIEILAHHLSAGKQIGDSLKKEQFREFPGMVVKMISIGEKTGKLEDMLIYLADFYEEEIDDITKNLSTLLEPVLLVSIGVVVGFVALAIISPIYDLTGSIK